MLDPQAQRYSIELGTEQSDGDFALGHEVGHDLLLYRGVADALRQASEAGYPTFRGRNRMPARVPLNGYANEDGSPIFVSGIGPDRDPEEYAASNFSHGMLLRRNHPALTEREVADLDRLRPGLLEAWRLAGESPAFRRAP